jgi:hypothetical protein
MALQKDITFKGLILDYWAITSMTWNKNNDTTIVTISPYASANSRLESANNKIPDLERIFTFNGEITRAQAYVLIKIPDLEPVLTGYSERLVQRNPEFLKEGEPTTNLVRTPIYEEQDVNFFSNAIDC